ncbi:fibronectin type III domain-containing protein, partial [bacterium]
LISDLVLPGDGSGKELYVDINVINDTTYYYVVIALDSADPPNESDNSTEASATPGTQPDYPPAAPSGLQVSASNGSGYLTWTAPTKNSDGSDIASDLAGYNVYRSDGDASSSVMINTSTIGSPSYTDTDLVSGVMYFYSVTALDNAAQESASSSQAVALYGDKGVSGRIRVRDSDSPSPLGYELVGVAMMEIYLVNSSGETLATTYTSADGTFTLIYEDAEVGVPYDVHLKVEDGTGYPYDELIGDGVGYLVLAEDIYIQDTGITQIVPEPAPIGVGPTLGDINCDGSINLFDVSYMKASFGSQTGDPDYDINSDTNGDGSINLMDISVIKGYFTHQTMTLPAGACN